MTAIGVDDLAALRYALRPGRAVMSVVSSAATSPDDTVSFKDVAGVWQLAPGAASHWGMPVNGRLEYVWPESRFVLLLGSVSMTAESANQVTMWRFAVNGVSLGSSEVQRKVGVAADVGAIGVVGGVVLGEGDYVTLQVRNSSTATDVTVEAASVVVVDYAT